MSLGISVLGGVVEGNLTHRIIHVTNFSLSDWSIPACSQIQSWNFVYRIGSRFKIGKILSCCSVTPPSSSKYLQTWRSHARELRGASVKKNLKAEWVYDQSLFTTNNMLQFVSHKTKLHLRDWQLLKLNNSEAKRLNLVVRLYPNATKH